jgi:hypothetical protein
MEDLEVFEDGVGQLDAGPPAVSVEQLDLHPGPDRNVASPPAKATAVPRRGPRLGSPVRHQRTDGGP